MELPEYTDGVVEFYEIKTDNVEDYPEEKIKKIDLPPVWYRELSIFDTTRAKLSSLSVEVTMKISIPQYRRINSGYICMIDGAQHEIYNAAHVTTKGGFKETELTLKTPTIDREVIEDDTEGTE